MPRFMMDAYVENHTPQQLARLFAVSLPAMKARSRISMATDRQRAKAAITSGSDEEPEFEDVLTDAKQYQLELAREANRHKETSRAAEIGLVGRFIGADGNAAHAIALIVIVFGLIAAIGCGVAAARRPNEKSFGVSSQTALLLLY